MKKLYSLLISICLCAVIFCQMPLSLMAETTALSKNTATVTVIDLVRLKKHLAGMRSYISDADYNADGKIDSRDMTALKRILLGLAVEDNTVSETTQFDNDGYYNQVIKP